MKATYDLVMEHCSPHIGCRKECLPVARRLKQTSCYRKGTVDEWARLNIEKESPDVLKMMKFYAALDSCDRELVLEENASGPEKCPSVIKVEAGNINGSGVRVANIPLVIFVVCSLLWFKRL
ncbi:uncharacterized protein LOC128553650 [Mercenaria mercenaria]|uniref:uncharacterized protein LOC128553650 n=1 Tax=Mercenaria mercenaria TaxID=6596 RepID=UPI00234EF815|nr:uncharacterized protein LOC128553650 [Mercenaria mercenaria]